MKRLIATLAITATCSFAASSVDAGGCHRSNSSYGHTHYSQPSYSQHYDSHHTHVEPSQPAYIVVQGQLYLLVDGRLFPVPTQTQPIGGPLPGQTFAAPGPGQTFAPPVGGQPLPGQMMVGPGGPGQSFNGPTGPGQSFAGPMGSGQPLSGPIGGAPTGQSFAGQPLPGQPMSGQSLPGQSLPSGTVGPMGPTGPIGGQPVVDPAAGFSNQPVGGSPLPTGLNGPSLGSPVADSLFGSSPVSGGPVLPPTVETSLTGPSGPSLPPVAESTTPVADVMRSEVYTGLPLQLSAPGCGDQAGVAVLRFPGFELPLAVNVWREGLIEVQLPTLSVTGNAEATLLVYRSDRTLFAELPLMLINAAQ